LPDPTHPSSRNKLLAGLPSGVLTRLWPRFRPVQLAFGDAVQVAGAPIAAVLFLESGFASVVVTLENGDQVEVAQIGAEGILGTALVLGHSHFRFDSFMQCAGTALMIESESLREAMEESPVLRQRLLGYVLVKMRQIAQIAACNGRHPTEQRLARWLLMAHDRAGTTQFAITHDMLSMMLGLRRAGVTIAAGRLQEAGAIRYGRGRLEIVNRARLEKVVCECYRAIDPEEG
jgi:CRP-like cAMP-binding protein